jgi:hypothetical protein
MIKRVSHIGLIFLLLSATTGMTVSKHYCGNFLVSTVFFGEAESCCDSGNCCHNESAFYQLDEDFSIPASAQIPQIIDFKLFAFIVEPSLEIFGDKIEKTFYTEREPLPPPNIQTVLSLKQAWIL